MAKIERKSFRNEGYDIFTCDPMLLFTFIIHKQLHIYYHKIQPTLLIFLKSCKLIRD
jgi:hypothetical protein